MSSLANLPEFTGNFKPPSYFYPCPYGCSSHQPEYRFRSIHNWSAHLETAHNHVWHCKPCGRQYPGQGRYKAYKTHLIERKHFHDGDCVDLVIECDEGGPRMVFRAKRPHEKGRGKEKKHEEAEYEENEEEEGVGSEGATMVDLTGDDEESLEGDETALFKMFLQSDLNIRSSPEMEVIDKSSVQTMAERLLQQFEVSAGPTALLATPTSTRPNTITTVPAATQNSRVNSVKRGRVRPPHIQANRKGAHPEFQTDTTPVSTKTNIGASNTPKTEKRPVIFQAITPPVSNAETSASSRPKRKTQVPARYTPAAETPTITKKRRVKAEISYAERSSSPATPISEPRKALLRQTKAVKTETDDSLKVKNEIVDKSLATPSTVHRSKASTATLPSATPPFITSRDYSHLSPERQVRMKELQLKVDRAKYEQKKAEYEQELKVEVRKIEVGEAELEFMRGWLGVESEGA